jgi:hypothetical protein
MLYFLQKLYFARKFNYEIIINRQAMSIRDRKSAVLFDNLRTHAPIFPSSTGAADKIRSASLDIFRGPSPEVCNNNNVVVVSMSSSSSRCDLYVVVVV